MYHKEFVHLNLFKDKLDRGFHVRTVRNRRENTILHADYFLSKCG